MDSIIDLLFFNLSKSEIEKKYSELDFEKKHFNFTNEKKLWIVFLPWGAKIEDGVKYNLLPKQGNVLVYQIQNGFVNKDPKIVKKIFKNLIRDVEKVEIPKFKGYSLNVISFSAANGYGFYIGLCPKTPNSR